LVVSLMKDFPNDSFPAAIPYQHSPYSN